MTEKEFIDRFTTETPIYEAYGRFLLKEINNAANNEKIPHSWFVIEPTSRVKDAKSLLAKAFYRNKSYADPYNDITDKVGIRFVLLTTDQVTEFTRVIENIETFITRKDRDYEREQNLNPTTFIYQSMHYIISLKNPVEFSGITIPTGIFCELQVRTLLQHAYSELTHDTIYKPKTIAEPCTLRLVARSMALIETTDSIFSEVGKQVSISKSKKDVISNSIIQEYSKKIKFEQEEKISNVLYDCFDKMIPSFDKIFSFIQSKAYIIERINERVNDKLLYRQPIILILYYIVYHHHIEAIKNWPFTQDEIELVYSDMGISIPIL